MGVGVEVQTGGNRFVEELGLTKIDTKYTPKHKVINNTRMVRISHKPIAGIEKPEDLGSGCQHNFTLRPSLRQPIVQGLFLHHQIGIR